MTNSPQQPFQPGPPTPMGGPGPQQAWGQPPIPGAPMPSPRKKNFFARHKILTVLGAIVVFIIFVSIASGGDKNHTATAPSSAPAADVRSDDPTATDDPTTSSGPAADPSDTPTEEATKVSGEGTRDNPYPIGTTVSNDDWQVTLGTPADGWKKIKAENSFNSKPEKGKAYYLVPVTAKYLGDKTGTAWLDISVAFVGSDSVTYKDRCTAVFPKDLMDVAELYKGGVAKGNACLVVPEGVDGVWSVELGLFEEPIFFSANVKS